MKLFALPGFSDVASELVAGSSLQREPFTLERFAECMGPDIAVGAVRASVGMASNADDIRRLGDVIERIAEQPA